MVPILGTDTGTGDDLMVGTEAGALSKKEKSADAHGSEAVIGTAAVVGGGAGAT